MILSALLCSVGLYCVISKRTLLGVFMGFQLMSLAAGLLVLLSGQENQHQVSSMVFSFFILLISTAQVAGALALGVRLFYLKRKVEPSEFRELRR